MRAGRLSGLITLLLAAVVASGCAGDDPGSEASAPEWVLVGDGAAEPPTLVEGAEQVGSALALDGATGYAAVAAPGGFSTTESFTVSAWVAIDGKAREFADAVSQTGEVASSFYLGIAEGAFGFSMKDQDTNEQGHTVRALGGAADDAAEGWHLIAGVFDADAGSLALFVDGEHAASTDFGDPIQVDGDIRLGAAQAHSLPAGLWHGAIADVRLRPVAATVEEIARQYAETRPAGDPPSIETDASAYGDAKLDGTWDSTLTQGELEMFAADIESESGRGPLTAVRMGFDGQVWWLGFILGSELWRVNGVPEGDNGVVRIDGDTLVTDNGSAIVTYSWALDGDTLTLVLEDCQVDGVECDDIDVVRILTARTFQRSGPDASP